MTELNGQEYGEMRDRMTRVETKLDLVLGQLSGAHTDHESRIRALEKHAGMPNASDLDHESRLRKLERTVWIWAGAAAAAGGGIGGFIATTFGG